MNQIGKREFIQHVSHYLRRVEKDGDEIIIMHHREPRLKLVPLRTKSLKDLKGILKKCVVKGDVNEPILSDFEQWLS